MKFLRLAVMLLLLFTQNESPAQTRYADKKFYLIDSLNLGKQSPGDRRILDSCLSIYHSAKDDTTRLKQLVRLAADLNDNNTWLQYAWLLKKEVEAALKKKNNDAVQRRLYAIAGNAHRYLGFHYSNVEINDSLSKHHNTVSLQYLQKNGDKKKIALAMTNLALNLENEGKIKEALDLYQQGLRIMEERKDSFYIASYYMNIGNLLRKQEDEAGALRYFHKTIPIMKKLGNYEQVAACLNFMGICYKYQKNYDSASIIYAEALNIYDSLDNAYGKATIQLNQGIIFQEQGDLDKALLNYNASKTTFEEMGDLNALSFALNSIAIIHLKKKEYAAAMRVGEQNMELSKQIGHPENIMNAAQLLSDVYKNTGRYKEALEMYTLFNTMNDSILNETTKRDAIEKDIKYQHDKELMAIQTEREKEALSAAKEQEKRNIIIISVLAVLLLLAAFSAFLYNRFRVIRKQKNIIADQKSEVEKQKEVIEIKNHEIVDSILYAKRLQEAILPRKSLFNEYLTESFVLYKPKDIVAGDFYFIERLGDQVIVAAADCTGHGVPGAMVSFVCVNALNRAVMEFDLREPAAILDKVSELVVQAFNKSEDEVKDGMDISICTINTKTNILMYAGAFNPLLILRSGAADIEEHKATKQAVGNVLKPVPFSNNTIQLSKGDTIYLFTDGFADQFGGPKGKKLKPTNFKSMLLNGSSLPLREQCQQLEKGFSEWKGELEQVDDVCVIGVRV